MREYDDNMPIRTTGVTVILITEEMKIYDGINISEKEKLISIWEQSEKKGQFIAVWGGQYRNDVFELPANKFIVKMRLKGE